MAEEKPKIPSWAVWNKDQVIVDMDQAYPRYLEQLALKPSQYSTGVAKLCITRDLADMTGIEGLVIRFKGAQDWKLDRLMPGLPQRHEIAYSDKLKTLDAQVKAKQMSETEAAEERMAMESA
jgi:hypothetical protein